MAIQTEQLRLSLKNKIKSALDASIDENSNSDTVKSELANSLANAIADGVDEWIKSATVTVNKGIQVITSGSATNQSGQTTSSGIGSIS